MRIKIFGFSAVILLSCFLWIYQDDDTALVELINKELAIAPAAAGRTVFDLLDATQFTDSMYPWIGFPVKVLSEKELFGEGHRSSVPPDEIKTKEILIKYKDKKRIIFNIPGWYIGFDQPDDVMTKKHVEWYLRLIKWLKEVAPETDVGVMGIPYSPRNALKSTKKAMDEYQRIEGILKPIVNASDTLYPLFQVYGSDKNDLIFMMGAQLYIAKTSGKQVYPVISHKNLVSDTGSNELVPVEMIRLQCEFLRANADGMVWWIAEPEAWDDRWYREVVDSCFI